MADRRATSPPNASPTGARPSRRTFLVGAAAAALAAVPLVLGARRARHRSDGRLLARPHPPTGTIGPGLASLGVAKERDTELFVPSSYTPKKAMPLMLALHGATQSSRFMLRILQDAAEAHGVLLLVPNSRGVTWDFVRGEFGDDEASMDRALGWCFDRCHVDPARVVIAGFSDGASAALTLGLINGDLFRRIIAFSPGFIVDGEAHGKPPIFISHGTADQILPIDDTSRRFVPELRKLGYAVTFKEFNGPHFAPPEVVAAAFDWLAKPA